MTREGKNTTDTPDSDVVGANSPQSSRADGNERFPNLPRSAVNARDSDVGVLRRVLQRLLQSDFSIPLVILVIVVAVAFIEPRFATAGNLQSVLRQLSILLVLGVAAALPILSGGLDLSLAGIAALGGVVFGLVVGTYGIFAGVVAALLTGLVMGAVNGAVISTVGASPLVVTLGMMSIARGLALLLTAGLPIYGLPARFTDPLSYGTVGGLPFPLLIAAGTLAVAAVVLRVSRFGRYVYAMGGNENAAFLSGVPVKLHKTGVYAFSGLVSAVAGIMLTGRVAAAQPTAGEGLELQAIGAVIIGGIALTGGHGSMKNVVYGVVLLAVVGNGMNLVGVSSFVQSIVFGVVLITAVVLDRLRAGSWTLGIFSAGTKT